MKKFALVLFFGVISSAAPALAQGTPSFQQLIGTHAKVVSTEIKDGTVNLFLQDQYSKLWHCAYKADLGKVAPDQQTSAVCALVR